MVGVCLCVLWIRNEKYSFGWKIMNWVLNTLNSLSIWCFIWQVNILGEKTKISFILRTQTVCYNKENVDWFWNLAVADLIVIVFIVRICPWRCVTCCNCAFERVYILGHLSSFPTLLQPFCSLSYFKHFLLRIWKSRIFQFNEWNILCCEEIRCYIGACVWGFGEVLGGCHSWLSHFYCREEKIGKKSWVQIIEDLIFRLSLDFFL